MEVLWSSGSGNLMVREKRKEMGRRIDGTGTWVLGGDL